MRAVPVTLALVALLGGCAAPNGAAAAGPGRVNATACPVSMLGVVAAPVGEPDSEASDVFLVDAQLGLTPLTSTGRAFNPVLDRSATRIAYLGNDGSIVARSASPPYQLWVGEVAGVRLTSHILAQSESFTSVAMAPDASAVAVVGTSALVGPDAPRPEIPLNPDGTLPDRQDSLYLVDLATGQPRVLVQGTPDAWVGEVSWTDDGSTLVYTVITRTGERFATTVWRRSATDPEAEPTRLYIYPDDSGVSVLEPAADGSAVTARALAADGLNTTRIPLDSGPAAPVVGADPLFTFSAISGGSLLGVLDQSPVDGKVEVQAVLPDGSSRTLGTLDVSRVSDSEFLPCLRWGPR